MACIVESSVLVVPEDESRVNKIVFFHKVPMPECKTTETPGWGSLGMSGKAKFFKKLRQQTHVILEQNRFLCFPDALSDMCMLIKIVNETL